MSAGDGGEGPRGGRRRVFRLGGPTRDVEEELAYHFDRTVAELEAEGMPREEAEAEARRRFGDPGRFRRVLKRRARASAVGAGARERLRSAADALRSAARGLARRPALSFGIVLTFALGVGANAVMFGVLDRILLRPPAGIGDASNVRRVISEQVPPFGTERVPFPSFTYPDYVDLADLSGVTGLAAYTEDDLVVGRGRDAWEASAVLASGTYFDVLQVRPALGRFFGPAEDEIGGDPVAVISHGLWQSRFGGDADVLGETLDLGPRRSRIVGVAPEGFTGVDVQPVDLWLPLLAADPDAEAFREHRGWWFLRLVARLAPGATADAAADRATAIHRAARAEGIEAGTYDGDVDIRLTSLIAAQGPLASGETVVAKWLAGVSFLVLIIAAANIANLLLSRAIGRRRETAVRLALGAPRARLAAETLLEGLLLALLGGAAALAVAHWGGSALRSALLPDVAWGEGLGARLVAFTLALSLVAGAAASLLPMVQGARDRLAPALASGAREIGGGRSRLRSGLTALQAGLSVVLLMGAGLFVRSLDRVSDVDLGFDPRGLIMVSPVADGLDPADRGAIFEAAKTRVAELGAVEATALTSASTPFYNTIVEEVRVPGLDSLPPLPGGSLLMHRVDGDYFRTLGLEVRAGRGIEPADVRLDAPVAVVNEVMARVLWPGGPALGECFHVDQGPCMEVVGIAGNAVIGGVAEEPRPQYYIPLGQDSAAPAPNNLYVRLARPDEPGAAALVRDAFVSLDDRVRYANVLPVRDLMAPQTRSWELGAALFSAFGLLALILAGIGLYSLLAYEVARRGREIGIRAALGATRGRIVREVVVRSVAVAGAGLAAGLVVALLVAPRLGDVLYETSPRDPAAVLGSVVVLLVVAAAAAMTPAWRASRVHPNDALGAE